jgi:hypothetical protein
MGEERKVFRVFVGKRRRPLGRPRRRWEVRVRMDTGETGLRDVDWIGFDCFRTGTGGGML